MTAHPLNDLSVLDQFAAKPFPPGWLSTHRTFNAPVDKVATACLYVVQSVQSKQVLGMYSYTHPTLIDAVVANIKAGIQTLIVLDSSEFNGPSEQKNIAPLIGCLGMSNLELSVGTAEDGHDIMHRKCFICDDSVVVTGSFNWSESACKEDNQTTIGIWPCDAALLTASIEATYEYQMQNCQQPTQGK